MSKTLQCPCSDLKPVTYLGCATQRIPQIVNASLYTYHDIDMKKIKHNQTVQQVELIEASKTELKVRVALTEQITVLNFKELDTSVLKVGFYYWLVYTYG
jgi:hypothetical protein